MQADTAAIGRAIAKALPNVAGHPGEHGALPWPILAILLVGMFVVGAYAIKKIGNLKGYLNEPPFPTHAATVVAGILAFMGFSIVAISRVALGMEMPENWGDFLLLMGGFVGIAGAWGVGKRVTSTEYKEGQAKVEAAKAGQAVPADMTVTAEQRLPAGRSTDVVPTNPKVVVPQAGVKPRSAEVVTGLETIAAVQKPAPLEPTD